MKNQLNLSIPYIGFLALVSCVFPNTTCAGQDAQKSYTNSLGMKFVRIEPGSFTMGSRNGDFDEVPTHSVTIRQPFSMSVREVTNAQYEQFDPKHKTFRGKNGFSKGDEDPVVFVTWHDAVKFCQWLSKKEGKTYRLPTEAEWEYACKAGTKTNFSFGDVLPKGAESKANAWGLIGMHGGVEEWCHDWYGPYAKKKQADPVGYVDGDFKVTRGGSRSTTPFYLRSANRMGTLPDDKHWLIGFRIVAGELPKTKPMPVPTIPLWGQYVTQQRHDWKDGPDPKKPYFRGPNPFVFIPPNSDGPLFSRHNHQPALTACPNGDLLAIWYSTRTEQGRELGVVAARLRHGQDKWQPAAPFWDAPDRNDHGSALLWDGKKTLYHFNGLAVSRYWDQLALIMRTSTDNGATWSKAKLIDPDHELHHQVIEGTVYTKNGLIILPCDAVPSGRGGTVIHISKDNGKTWTHPAKGKSAPTFADGKTGNWIAGIHGGVTQLDNGNLIAFGRGDTINGKLPMSISKNLGKSWTYHPSPFPPIGGGQRLILERLREGPLLLISFAKSQTIKDAKGTDRTVTGMFAALSYDNGKTWPVRRLITDGGPDRLVDGGGNTRMFTLGKTSAEPRGYLSCTQTPDGVIHLISSKQHYRFNLKWLQEN